MNSFTNEQIEKDEKIAHEINRLLNENVHDEENMSALDNEVYFSNLRKSVAISTTLTIFITLTVILFAVTSYFKGYNIIMIVGIVIYLPMEWYFQYFHQFEKRSLPVPSAYRSNIPMIFSTIGTICVMIGAVLKWI